MKCATLLCVDDNAAILTFYLILLSRHGYDVLPASDGNHALEVFRAYASKISAVILDYQMPGMNGLELAASLKQTAPSLPILMISTAPPRPEEMSPFVDATITKGNSSSSHPDSARTLIGRAPKSPVNGLTCHDSDDYPARLPTNRQFLWHFSFCAQIRDEREQRQLRF